MNKIFLIFGMIAGVFLFHGSISFTGLIVGGLLGFLLHRVMELHKKIEVLEKDLQVLRAARRHRPREQAAGKQQPAGESVVTTGSEPPGKSLPARKTGEKPLSAPTRPPRQAATEPSATPRPALDTIAESPAKPSAPSAEPDSEPTFSPSQPAHDLWNILLSYFTGGNTVVRVGMVVLFFGVAFLLKYSVEQGWFPIELRLAGVALGAIALLVIGWRLRLARPAYSLIMQGGGVGILYMVVFAAMKLYHLLPFALALALLVCIAAFSAALAIIRDARSLAVIGISGGFLAPVLLSTGTGNHVMLFSYFALLNSGILGIAWYKSWRELNLLGFVFTFGIGGVWGGLSYQPTLFAGTEPFLILFFLFYVTIGFLFARNQPLREKGYVDSTMIFGTPLVCFGMQAALVEPYEYGLAWSALGMAALYVMLARFIFAKGSVAMRTVIEAFLSLAVVFGTVAIPLALDGRWTSGAWALEGAAIVWVALRQQRVLARIFGLCLQLLAGLAFLSALGGPDPDWPLINGVFIAALVISLAALLSAYMLLLFKDQLDSAEGESFAALLWGLMWWFGGGMREIDIFVSASYSFAWFLGFCAFSALLAQTVGRKLAWNNLQHVYKGLSLVMTVGVLYSLIEKPRPSVFGGFAAWPLAFACHYLALFRDNTDYEERLRSWLHAGPFLLLIVLVTWEASWWTDDLLAWQGVWSLAVMGLVPALFMLAIAKYHARLPWPVAARPRNYLYDAMVPVALYLAAGVTLLNLTNAGNPWPLPYLPFFNPFDLTIIFVVIVACYWVMVVSFDLPSVKLYLERRQQLALLSIFVFLWLNGVLPRTLHHWGGVRFTVRSMLASDLAQTSLSIFWTLSALVIMLWATKKSERPVWMVGAGLIGVVISKLFLFDLANTGTMERIISFMGVGGLCLLIGYLAPLPGRTEPSHDSTPTH